MKVSELVVESFKKISRVAVKLGEHVTEISGPNGAGKSSFLDALWVLLDGKSVAPPELIRQGAHLCRIKGRIGEYLVTREFKRSKGGEITRSLRIERGKEGMPSTETFLRQLIGEHMLDPGEFISLDVKGKFDALKAFVPGIDFAKVAREDKADRDRRTRAGNLRDEARASANMIIVPDRTPEALVDEADLTEKLGKAAETNADLARRRANRQRGTDDIARLRAEHANAQVHMDEYTRARNASRDERVGGWRAEIERIQGLIAAEEAKAEQDIRGAHARIRETADEAERKAISIESAIEAAGPLPDPVDVVSLQEQLNAARKTNEHVRRRLDRDKHEKLADQYDEEYRQLTDSINARESAKQTAIAAAKLPVPEISFGDGELLLNGVPFEQASTAQKLRVGVAIAIQKNPTLRLAWIRDASLLDDESYQSVKHLSEEFDCQILLETVRAIGSDAILLEDGHLKGDAMAAEAISA